MFEIRKLSDKLGLEVLGLDAGAIDSGQQLFLRDLFWKTGALLFKNLHITPQQMHGLSDIFGGAQLYPIPSVRIEGLPEVGVLATNHADLTPVYLKAGQPLKYVIPWHADCMFYETPTAGNMLYALQVPEEGGQTGLIDTVRTYQMLSEDMKKSIDDLEIICRFRTTPYLMKFGRDLDLQPPTDQNLADHEEYFPEFTDKVHPLVLKHPITGHKCLNVNPFVAEGLVGIDKEEGDMLLEQLISHSTTDQFSYFHDWQAGDLLVFDNYRMLHSVKGVPPQYERLLHSVVLRGDVKTGRELAAG
ncbi:TauD/TfdA family dioxygenase [Halieaceae bacterium]|nr:TauD/TfdA family dioxygenase [Halieaceae bacterium]